MRKIYIIFCLCLIVQWTFGQTAEGTRTSNIVPNPSFELYSSTPIGWFYKGKHFTDVMKYWSSATGASPDIFGPKVRVPAQWAAKGFGEKEAHDGFSMVGITLYGCEGGKPHCREYVQIQLAEPLVTGQNYYAEFWVCHLDRSLQVNNIGMAFSDEKIKVKTDSPLELTPQVKADYIVSARQWTRVTGRFKAVSDANYLIIGNFCPDSLTHHRAMSANNLNYAYYYVDDVMVKKEDPILEVPVKEDDLSKVILEKGKVIALRNIFFDTDKAELLPRSFIELNKLLTILRDNPAMIIEVQGHTDSIGGFQYNLSLSQRRAKAVVDYLHKRGISRSRCRFKGYGSSSPIADNGTEEGRRLNRRVAFLILNK
ncbi:MAG: OmpA family protein [Bacteroidota bacterium]